MKKPYEVAVKLALTDENLLFEEALIYAEKLIPQKYLKDFQKSKVEIQKECNPIKGWCCFKKEVSL
jgi:hypothetical protein